MTRSGFYTMHAFSPQVVSPSKSVSKSPLPVDPPSTATPCSDAHAFSQEPPSSPLLEARLKQKLSLTEVARRLCLKEEIVKNLEEEKWDAFVYEDTYVIGFLYTYAKVLAVDSQAIVERFKTAQHQKRSIPVLPPPAREVLAPPRSSIFVRWTSLVASLLLMGIHQGQRERAAIFDIKQLFRTKAPAKFQSPPPLPSAPNAPEHHVL